MPIGGRKGSAFEREISKKLSLWWTDGKRDDVFWRSQTSGARATQRNKKGQKTFGQEGDIQAVDPIGQPLIDVCTIELKTGYSTTTIQDMIDSVPGRVSQFEKFVQQAIRECQHSDSYSWMLIFKRNQRQPMVFLPSFFFWNLEEKEDITPAIRLHLGDKYEIGGIYGFPMDVFLKEIKKSDILHIWKKKMGIYP